MLRVSKDDLVSIFVALAALEHAIRFLASNNINGGMNERQMQQRDERNGQVDSAAAAVCTRVGVGKRNRGMSGAG